MCCDVWASMALRICSTSTLSFKRQRHTVISRGFGSQAVRRFLLNSMRGLAHHAAALSCQVNVPDEVLVGLVRGHLLIVSWKSAIEGLFWGLVDFDVGRLLSCLPYGIAEIHLAMDSACVSSLNDDNNGLSSDCWWL
ncbi:hypothetical protein AKJ16_DCAP14294 [Drosera capensis]